jgi:hypothetical protein
MNLRTLLVIIIGIVIVMAMIIGLGAAYKGKNPGSQLGPQVEGSTSDAVKVLSSKLTPIITVRGQVTSINGKAISLNYQSDTRIINLRSDAKVYGLVAQHQAGNKIKYIRKAAVFKDIKTNDNIEVNLRVSPAGQIEGYYVLIMPSVLAASSKK